MQAKLKQPRKTGRWHPRTWLVLAIATGALHGLGSSSARAQDLPPLNNPSSGDYFPGKFVWADLFTPDPNAAAQFYTSLFGWQATTLTRPSANGQTHPYLILSNEGRPIAGIALRPSKLHAPHGRWIGYISVPDVGQALATAKAAGARVLFPMKTLPQRGTQAVILNPDGSELGLIHSASGDPGEYAPDPGDWTWAQLFTNNVQQAAQYYANLVGYQAIPDDRDGQSGNFILASGGYSRAAIDPLPDRPNAHPAWLLLVRVDDVKAVTAKAESLGGKVLRGPGDDPTEFWKAIIADPTGGVIGIVQLEGAAAAKATPQPAPDSAPSSPDQNNQSPSQP